ncbi:MAG: fused response regulator/phosphatase [Caldicoprobacterales bacterium]|jgi:sigma-B regulation protein RsbU (phosphoserine phosphatase)
MAYNILIADDMLLNRKLIKRALEQKIDNVNFLEVDNGNKALEYIFKGVVDIVILDLIMPGKNGFEVIKEVKSLEEYRDIPIIVNSAMDEIDIIQQALELGATDYFTKPLTMQQMQIVLPVKVKNALKSYEQKRLLLEMNQRMKEQLKVATALQNILIDESKSLPGVEMIGKYIPSSELSGDFYECIQIKDEVWIFIADVSGHGVAAAMISSMMKVMFKNLVTQHSTPAGVLREMNSTFYNITHGTYYITAFIGLIKDDLLIYANGGHPYPIMVDTQENKVFMLENNGFIIGIVNDYEYPMHSIKMKSGDYIVMYTDGLLEPEESEKRMKSCDDLLTYFEGRRDMIKQDPALLLDSIVKDFGKDTSHTLKDDVAIMIIRNK